MEISLTGLVPDYYQGAARREAHGRLEISSNLVSANPVSSISASITGTPSLAASEEEQPQKPVAVSQPHPGPAFPGVQPRSATQHPPRPFRRLQRAPCPLTPLSKVQLSAFRSDQALPSTTCILCLPLRRERRFAASSQQATSHSGAAERTPNPMNSFRWRPQRRRRLSPPPDPNR
jgi:hypothetical protein